MVGDQIEACINSLYLCAASCEKCVHDSFNNSFAKDVTLGIKIGLDCAEVCRIAASHLHLDSSVGLRLCSGCIALGESFVRFLIDHHITDAQNCIAACQKCIGECEILLAEKLKPVDIEPSSARRE